MLSQWMGGYTSEEAKDVIKEVGEQCNYAAYAMKVYGDYKEVATL